MHYPMFATFNPEMTWLVVMLAIAMVIMAVVDFRYLKIHNVLTFPVIFSGWAFALINGWMNGADIEMYLPTNLIGMDKFVMFELHGGLGGAVQGLWHSVGLSFLGLALLIPLYSIGGVGAGDMKMQMGFGAWVAPIYGWSLGLQIVLWGFAVGAIVGGVLSAIIIWWTGSYRQNIQNTKEILGDLFTKSFTEVNERAAARKKTLQLVPYGVPLGIGYLGYVIWEWYQSLQITS